MVYNSHACNEVKVTQDKVDVSYTVVPVYFFVFSSFSVRLCVYSLNRMSELAQVRRQDVDTTFSPTKKFVQKSCAFHNYGRVVL